jgi:hypothetical protein
MTKSEFESGIMKLSTACLEDEKQHSSCYCLWEDEVVAENSESEAKWKK